MAAAGVPRAFTPARPGPIVRAMTDLTSLMGRTVLVVDDEPHLTAVVAYNLRRAGARVVTAGDGRAALAALGGEAVDAIVTDYQMPIVDGGELARRLAGDPRTAGVPVLMLTGRGHRLGSAELAGTNVRCVMGKPFSAADLVGRVGGLMPQQPSEQPRATR